MKLGLKLAYSLVISIFFFATSVQAQDIFRARLSPMPTTPQTVSTILGAGEVILTLNGNSLSIDGDFTGMSSVATGAHIHNGPPAQPGPVIHTLEITEDTSGSLGGTLTLTDEEIESLKNNEFYIQIHTETNPPGELRGWVFLRSHFDRN